MWKKMLVTASLVLFGSFTAFSQQDKASCPTDTKEVKEKVDVDLGIVGYERETRECQPQDSKDRDKQEAKDKETQDKGPKDKADKDRPEKSRN